MLKSICNITREDRLKTHNYTFKNLILFHENFSTTIHFSSFAKYSNSLKTEVAWRNHHSNGKTAPQGNQLLGHHRH